MGNGNTQPSTHRTQVTGIVRSVVRDFRDGDLDDAKALVAGMHPDKLATVLFIVSRTYRERDSE